MTKYLFLGSAIGVLGLTEACTSESNAPEGTAGTTSSGGAAAAGAPATPPPDAASDASTPSCGDGNVDDGERCDPGRPTRCAELGGSWNDGMAACRADCAG
jgi:hypothetical protein